jgi:hypothetical protein
LFFLGFPLPTPPPRPGGGDPAELFDHVTADDRSVAGVHI